MQQIKDVIASVIMDFQSPEKQNRQKLTQKWAEIAGPLISKHTRPSLTKDGRLYVWVDNATLAFELSQKYRQSLLKRIQALLGESEVKTLQFRVGQLR